MLVLHIPVQGLNLQQGGRGAAVCECVSTRVFVTQPVSQRSSMLVLALSGVPFFLFFSSFQGEVWLFVHFVYVHRVTGNLRAFSEFRYTLEEV